MSDTGESGGAGGTTAERHSTTKRVLTWLTVGVVTLVITPLVLAIIFGPSALAWVAPRIVANISDDLDGSMEIDGATFSWLDGSSIEGLRINDAEGHTLVEVNVSSTRGILALLRDRRDLGELHLSGMANLERDESGSLNLARVFVPLKEDADWTVAEQRIATKRAARQATRAAKPGRRDPVRIRVDLDSLPPFKAKLVVDDLDVRFKDPALVEVSGGAFDAVAVEDLQATGAIGPDEATFVMNTRPFVELAGSRSAGEVSIDARLANGEATLVASVSSDAVDLAAEVGANADAVWLRAPLEVVARGGAYKPWLPRDGSVEVTRAPELRLVVESALAPLVDKTLDLDHASFAARLESAGAAGRMDLGDGSMRDVELAPWSLRLSSDSLSGPVHASGSGAATIDGMDAGSFAVELVGVGLVSGGRLAAPSDLDGRATISGVRTALAQPFVGDDDIDLDDLLGPTLDASLTATDAPDGSGAIEADLDLKSALARVVAPLRIEAGGVRAQGPVVASHERVGELLAAFLGESGEGFERGGRGEARIDRLWAPFEEGSRRVDVSRLSADATVALTNVGFESDTLGVRTIERLGIEFGAGPQRVVASLNANEAGGGLTAHGSWTLAGVGSLVSAFRQGLIPAPSGRLDVTGSSADLIEVLAGDYGDIARAALAGDASLRVETSAQGDGVGFDATLDSPGARLEAIGALGGKAGARTVRASTVKLTSPLSAAVAGAVSDMLGKTPAFSGSGAGTIGVEVGAFNAQLSGGRLVFEGAGPEVTLHGANLPMAWIGSLIDEKQSRVLAEAVGPTADVDGVVRLGTDGAQRVSISIGSERIKTKQRLELARTDGSLGIEAPARFVWTVAPGVISAALATDDEDLETRLAEPIEAMITVESLRIGTGGREPLDPEVFDVSAKVVTGPVSIDLPSGKKLDWGKIVASIDRDDSEPDALAVRARLVEADSGAEAKLSALIDDVADATGRFTLGAIKVSAQLNASEFPVAVCDAAAAQDGLLNDLLGEQMNLLVRASKLGVGTGKLHVVMESPRATLTLEGDAEERVFNLASGTKATIDIITEAMGERINHRTVALPGLVKTRGQQPATVETSGLSVPLDGDYSKLSGTLRIDPGVATITRNARLAKTLRLPGGERRVGERLDPLEVTAEAGVVTIPRYHVPLGEFDIRVEGTFDMVTQTVDMVLWAPMGNLTDEAVGALNLGLGNALGTLAAPILGEATLVPIRVRGPAASPSVSPDTQLMLQTLPGRIRPARNLMDSINSALGGIWGGG